MGNISKTKNLNDSVWGPRAVIIKFMVRCEGICKDCCILNRCELPEVSTQTQIDTAPTAKFEVLVILQLASRPSAAFSNIRTHIGFSQGKLLDAQSTAFVNEYPPQSLVFDKKFAYVLSLFSPLIDDGTFFGDPGRSAEGIKRETLDQSNHAVLKS